LQSYHIGLEVGRYVSLERVIEENKDRYYETLEQSSQRWHEGTHDPLPYINYILFVRAQLGEFRLADIERACPGVGREWIRKLLVDLRSSGEVTCRGKGPAARWRNETSKGRNSK
jgi:hypothetical protein